MEHFLKSLHWNIQYSFKRKAIKNSNPSSKRAQLSICKFLVIMQARQVSDLPRKQNRYT